MFNLTKSPEQHPSAFRMLVRRPVCPILENRTTAKRFKMSVCPILENRTS
ncbi:hypothetical protein HMPREF0168_1698 [Bifidobacterium dentium ATCC 27679]|uniref:Uncharacterized protein n=1 Tax=Bifidobacterium dentium ATCC 27679 TaxID=871562 RepID=E0Q9Q0_9BIFI|nr:hypothetical protein HMPREF0168_1698 [Bifidobacterium dentium ATCC 27679]